MIGHYFFKKIKISLKWRTFVWESVELNEVMSAIIEVILAAKVVVLGSKEYTYVDIGCLVAAHHNVVCEGFVVEAGLASSVVDVFAIFGHLHVNHIVEVHIEIVEVCDKFSYIYIVNLEAWELQLQQKNVFYMIHNASWGKYKQLLGRSEYFTFQRNKERDSTITIVIGGNRIEE